MRSAAPAAPGKTATAAVEATAAATDMRLLNDLHISPPLSVDALLCCAFRVMATGATDDHSPGSVVKGQFIASIGIGAS